MASVPSMGPVSASESTGSQPASADSSLSSLEPLQLDLDTTDNVPFSQSLGTLFHDLGLNVRAANDAKQEIHSLDLSYDIENISQIKDVNPEWSTDDIDEIVLMSKRREILSAIEDDPSTPTLNHFLDVPSLSDFSFDTPSPRYSGSAKVKVCTRRDNGKKYIIKCKRYVATSNKWDEKAILECLSKRNPTFCSQLRWSIHQKEYQYIITDAYPNSLSDIIARYGSFASHHALFYASELVSAIGYLHSAGVIHRDLRPDNVMLDEAGHIVLTNFERSTFISGHEPNFVETIFKAEEHIAPELLLGWAHDVSVDIWGFGILLYFMYFGQSPFSSHSQMGEFQMLSHQIVENAIPPESLRLIHPLARDLILKCLERNPLLRWNLDKIKKHAYFSQVGWQNVSDKKIEVPYFIPLTVELEQKKFPDPAKKRVSTNTAFLRQLESTFPSPEISKSPQRLRSLVEELQLAPIPPTTQRDSRSIPLNIPEIVIEEEEPVEAEDYPPPAHGFSGGEPSVDTIGIEEKFSQIWQTVDRDLSAVEQGWIGDEASKHFSRPQKLRKHRSSIQPRLFNLSTASFHGKIWKKPRSASTLRTPIINTSDPRCILPIGSVEVGPSAGFSYNLPNAIPTVASFAPTGCSGMFQGGFSVSRFGFGPTFRLKDKSAVTDAKVLGSTETPASTLSSGTSTFIHDMHRNGWGDVQPSPPMGGIRGDHADVGPATPTTLVHQEETVNIKIPKDVTSDYPEGAPDMTLRLVPSSGGLRMSFLNCASEDE